VLWQAVGGMKTLLDENGKDTLALIKYLSDESFIAFLEKMTGLQRISLTQEQ